MRYDQEKEAETQKTLQRSFFDALVSYAKKRGADVDVMDSDSRTYIAEVSKDVLSPFVGVHRIQREPKSDKAGRRHTSTVVVTFLPEYDFSTNSELDESDLRETFTRGSGNGGQHRNTTDNCVVLEHRPTGISVRVDGRSQLSNRIAARTELRRRLHSAEQRRASTKRNRLRRDQSSTGQRPVKSFTHNAQRNETICHKNGKRWRMDKFLKGKI